MVKFGLWTVTVFVAGMAKIMYSQTLPIVQQCYIPQNYYNNYAEPQDSHYTENEHRTSYPNSLQHLAAILKSGLSQQDSAEQNLLPVNQYQPRVNGAENLLDDPREPTRRHLWHGLRMRNLRMGHSVTPEPSLLGSPAPEIARTALPYYYNQHFYHYHHAQQLPCRKNVLIACHPQVQYVPCSPSYEPDVQPYPIQPYHIQSDSPYRSLASTHDANDEYEGMKIETPLTPDTYTTNSARPNDSSTEMKTILAQMTTKKDKEDVNTESSSAKDAPAITDETGRNAQEDDDEVVGLSPFFKPRIFPTPLGARMIPSPLYAPSLLNPLGIGVIPPVPFL